MTTLAAGLAFLASCAAALALAAQSSTTLLPGAALRAIGGEASGARAKHTVVDLGRMHRVHGSPGFHQAAEYIAGKAREYGLEDVHIESFPADGKTTYGTFRAYYGWQAKSGILTEVAPRRRVLGDYSKVRVALADYSNSADVTADLIDCGPGVSDADYAGKDVKGKIVLAGGSVAGAHHQSVELRGAAGVLSYQPNQITGWSGDYPDLIRWGHLSPYNMANTFAFMISLREARDLRARLAKGERIRLHAAVHAQMRAADFEVVTGVIRGTDPNSGEIVLSCHLCHQSPGANDDASGAATILEDARLLAKLIDSGKLARPRRTIRFMWPPEIAGTACYLARHPDEASQMIAAIHMDMVGGDPHITKAILHLTRTPASLPSFVDDVAAVFGEYVIDGARRAAMAGDTSNANYSPEGSKDMLVADFHDFTMGSDHDVYQEGTYRVPTIYLNDWPDVFIHTDRDKPENLDATKLQRVAVIGAASGYFLASAGKAEARTLAMEVFLRGAARQSAALARGLAASDAHDGQTLNMFAGQHELAAMRSILRLAPDAAQTVAGFVSEIWTRENQARAIYKSARGFSEFWSSPYVPIRNPEVKGPLDVYYYDYIRDHLKDAAEPTLTGVFAYEALNLADGKRTVWEIADELRITCGPVSSQDVIAYFVLLQRAGVVALKEDK